MEVDYLSINLKETFGLLDLLALPQYFDSIGFYSEVLFFKGTRNLETIIGLGRKLNDKFKVEFQRKESYGKTLYSLHFKGKNGARFYKLVKDGSSEDIPQVIKDGTIGRFDLAFVRPYQSEDSLDSLIQYYADCQKNIVKKTRIKHVKTDLTEEGYKLAICHRTGPSFYRIYKYFNSSNLKFEFEMKRRTLQKFHVTESFFNNQFSELENELTPYFFKRWKYLIKIDSKYSDWLIYFYRLKNITKQHKEEFYPLPSLKFCNSRVQDLKHIKANYTWIQFLWFLQKNARVVQRVNLDYQEYLLLRFTLREFFFFTKSPNKESDPRYQIHQLRELLEVFRKDPKARMQYFDCKNFRDTLNFPTFRITQTKRSIEIYLSVTKEFSQYKYPYWFSYYFKNYRDAIDLRVKLFVVQTYTSIRLRRKTFPVADFIASFIGKIPNGKITQVKYRIFCALTELTLTFQITKVEVSFHEKDKPNLNLHASQLSQTHINSCRTISLIELSYL